MNDSIHRFQIGAGDHARPDLFARIRGNQNQESLFFAGWKKPRGVFLSGETGFY
jgi:hypothetical protein